MDVKTKAALLSVLSNGILTVLKFIVGLFTNSVSIMSESIHSGIDLIASVIAFFAVRVANKPADEKHQYGHGKYENISGTIEALLIFVAAIWIMSEAFEKLLNNEPMESFGLGFIVMSISAIFNFYVSSHLYKVAKAHDSIALEADALHLRTDVYTSLGVLVGLVLIYFTGWQYIDPLIAILVSLFIIKEAWEIVNRAFKPLVDTSIEEQDENEIKAIIEKYSFEYIEFHSLRTRKSGSEIHIDLHLVVPRNWPIEKVHDICNIIERDIKKKYSSCHCLIHAEPCNDLYEVTEKCDSDKCPFLGKMEKKKHT